MRGHAKIELTNAKTGQTQVIENDNMVTNALNDLFGSNFLCQNVYPAGVNNSSYSTSERKYPLDQYFPMIPKAIGGIYLFNKPNEEDKNKYFAPIDNKLIGCGSNDVNSTNLIKNRGNFNKTASKFSADGKSYSFVWDFTQEQANGEISSISLTSALGGKQYFTDCEYNPFYYINVPYSGFSGFPGSFFTYLLPYDIDFEKGILFVADLQNKSNGKVRFRKYSIPTSGALSLNSSNSIQEDTAYAKEITVSDTIRSIFKDGSVSLYVLQGYIYMFTSSTSSYYSSSKLYLTKISADTLEVVEEKQILSEINASFPLAYRDYASHNTNPGLVYNGKIILPYINPSNQIGIYLFDPDSEIVDDLGLIGAPFLLLNDTLITLTSIYDLKNRAIISSNCFTLFRGNSGLAFGRTYANNNGYPYLVSFLRVYNNNIVLLINTYSTAIFQASILPQYLVTINNLPEPITKTSDQTMRITYTLTEE